MDAQTVGSAKHVKFHVIPENVDLTVASGGKKSLNLKIYKQIF